MDFSCSAKSIAINGCFFLTAPIIGIVGAPISAAALGVCEVFKKYHWHGSKNEEGVALFDEKNFDENNNVSTSYSTAYTVFKQEDLVRLEHEWWRVACEERAEELYVLTKVLGLMIIPVFGLLYIRLYIKPPKGHCQCIYDALDPLSGKRPLEALDYHIKKLKSDEKL